MKRIIIAGGSGFIGSALAKEFSRRGYAVVVLTRSPRERTDGAQEVFWDSRSGKWMEHFEGAEAVINLTGKNVNCPHTPENVRRIISSRVASVNAVAAAIASTNVRPRVWVQASAIGFYGDTQDRLADESAPNGQDTLAQICREWEAAAAKTPDTRQVTLRIGFVLGREGGALPVLTKLVKFFLGGAVGTGKQFISWIHLADLVQMFVVAVEDENLSGTFNAVAPNAVANGEFMRELRRALHRPWSPPAPEFAVKLGARLMGSEPSLALVSQRCEPKRFREAGFEFQYSNLSSALENLCRNHS